MEVEDQAGIECLPDDAGIGVKGVDDRSGDFIANAEIGTRKHFFRRATELQEAAAQFRFGADDR